MRPSSLYLKKKVQETAETALKENGKKRCRNERRKLFVAGGIPHDDAQEGMRKTKRTLYFSNP